MLLAEESTMKSLFAEECSGNTKILTVNMLFKWSNFSFRI